MNILLGLSAVSILGSNVVARISTTIIGNTIGMMMFITSGSKSVQEIDNVKQRIEEMDIDIKLKILKKYIVKENKTDIDSSIIEGVDEIIKICEILLSDIYLEIEAYSGKWVKRYRFFNAEDKMVRLSKYNNILKNRIEMLVLNTEM